VDRDVLHGYTGSDFAGDRAGRKSQGCYIFRLYGGPIDWQLKKQLLVATSTTEAKYVACSGAARGARRLVQLHTDVAGDLVSPPIYCDSNGARISGPVSQAQRLSTSISDSTIAENSMLKE